MAIDQQTRRAELAAFLRVHRVRLTPSDVGLPEGPTPSARRTPGLRREEVAELSGVSVTWYTYLEQGRDVRASTQVVDALARALRLDPDQHRHLRSLAGLAPPARDVPVDDADPRLRQLVDAVAPNAASIYDVHLNYLAWNAAYVRLRLDPGRLPAGRRNLLWMMFTDADNRVRMVRWESAARAVLGQFRAAAGRRPDDPRYNEIAAELSEESEEFREWWSQYPVRSFRPATIGIDHPTAGRVMLRMFQLRPAENPDLLLVMQVPATPTDLQRMTAVVGRRH